MKEPLAYFLTWTTYGTWLPGDAKGWVRHGDDTRYTLYRSPDPKIETHAKALMKQKPVILDKQLRGIVERTIRESCQYKNWHIHALNVRTNHIHLVITSRDETPEQVMTTLKGWASRKLNQRISKTNNRRWWTRHGSTRYINSESSLLQTIEYVHNQ